MRAVPSPCLTPKDKYTGVLPELAEASHTPTTPDADQRYLTQTHATSMDSCSQLPSSDTQPQQTPTQLKQYPRPPDLVPHAMNHTQPDSPRTFTETKPSLYIVITQSNKGKDSRGPPVRKKQSHILHSTHSECIILLSPRWRVLGTSVAPYCRPPSCVLAGSSVAPSPAHSFLRPRSSLSSTLAGAFWASV